MNGKVYVIKNNVNDKVYVGQTVQRVVDRFKQHTTRTTNQVISKAIKSFGADHFYFEVLEEGITTYEELNEKEIYYINKFNSLDPNGYNLCPGGQMWRRCPTLKEETTVELAKLYSEGLSTRALAERFNINHKTVQSYLAKAGVKMRGKSSNLPDRTSKLTRELMIDLYVNKNMKMKDIAELLNVNVKTVNRAKNRYDLSRI